jgi:O-antigen/teichoic acid export membrane protein
MKKKGLKKNTFIQGTLIASISMIFIKVIGAVYVVPFYAIIGESGGTLYRYAYSIYNLFLNISTAGVPIAMSMIISEYLTLLIILLKSA